MNYFVRIFLLITFASAHSNYSFEFHEKSEHFNSNGSKYSSFDLYDMTQQSDISSNVHWFKRKLLSKQRTHSKRNIFKSSQQQFQQEPFFEYTNDTESYLIQDEKYEEEEEEDTSENISPEENNNNDNINESKELLSPESKIQHEPEPSSFTSIITESISKITGGSKPTIEKRQDKSAAKQMQMQMIANKNQMVLQTINNVVAMSMMMKMKMKKMKYDMMKKKMKMKYSEYMQY